MTNTLLNNKRCTSSAYFYNFYIILFDLLFQIFRFPLSEYPLAI